jgi:hypothetical protein
MELDIHAFSNLSKNNSGSGIILSANDIWYNQSKGLKEGYYLYDGEFSFRVGSYGTYNDWRNELSIMSGYGKSDDHWNYLNNLIREEKINSVLDIKEKIYLPFSELICFSDCEGYIGTKICHKLYKDFVNNKALAEKKSLIMDERKGVYSLDGVMSAGQWFLDRYNNFMKAFEYGSNNGCVMFC